MSTFIILLSTSVLSNEEQEVGLTSAASQSFSSCNREIFNFYRIDQWDVIWGQIGLLRFDENQDRDEKDEDTVAINTLTLWMEAKKMTWMNWMIKIKMMMTWITLSHLGVDWDQKSTLAGAILLCCSPAAQIIIDCHHFGHQDCHHLCRHHLCRYLHWHHHSSSSFNRSIRLTWQRHNRRRRKHSRHCPPQSAPWPG